MAEDVCKIMPTSEMRALHQNKDSCKYMRIILKLAKNYEWNVHSVCFIFLWDN